MGSDTSFYCKHALTTGDLVLEEDVLFETNDGIISGIHPGASPKDAETTYLHHVAMPVLINSHIHMGDAVVKDGALGLPLEKAVGTEGYKFKALQDHFSKIVTAIRSTGEESLENGVRCIVDFREGGLQGIQLLKEGLEGLPIQSLILGRPVGDESTELILENSGGLGISSPTEYSDDQLIDFNKKAREKGKIVATHVLEEPAETKKSLQIHGSSDLERAVELLKADLLVHLTNLSQDEVSSLPKNCGFILCPRSNAYFGLGQPPLKELLKEYPEKVALGTDNVMTTSPDPLEEARWVAYQLLSEKSEFDPRMLLRSITTVPSKLFSFPNALETGNPARFCLIDLDSPRTRHSQNVYNSILFRARCPDIALKFPPAHNVG